MKKKKGLTITWLGHSAFHIITGQGTSILIDPWLKNPKAPANVEHITPVDIILISHGHSDHMGDTVSIAKRTNARVLSNYEIAQYLIRKGVVNAQAMNKGGGIRSHDLLITMVDAKHSSDIDADGTVVPGGEAAGFILESDNGPTIYHAGDTAVFSDMVLIGKIYKPDIALLPIGDCFTMGAREAAIASNLLKPRHIIGMHYGTFPALSGTPEDLRKLLSPDLKKRLKVLHPGIPEPF